MKNIARIPTILGLILLIVGIIAGVFLIKNSSNWFFKAGPGETPKQVKITNITDTGFSVSWVTDAQTSGLVKYGVSGSDLSFSGADDRDQLSGKTGSFLIHHVTLKNLKAATVYYFKIISGESAFDNNGQSYQVTTGSAISLPPPPNDIAYGTIVDQNGSPAEGMVVYLVLANANTLSTLTKSSGSWVIPLSIARSSDLSSYASYDRDASIEEIFVQGGSSGTATAVSTTKYDSPLSNIALGQSYDFRKGESKTSPTPTRGASPRFTTQDFTGVGSSANLAIINPSQGENVNTRTPEIFGTGPVGEKLTIVVNSQDAIEDEVTIGEDGNWSWTPSSDLAPGEHTVTVTLADGRTISRRFMVLAAGDSDSPAFEASASATPTSPMPTATSTPTPTPTTPARTSLPSTEGGVPTSGNLTPTFIFFIMGIVTMLMGIVINILLKKVR